MMLWMTAHPSSFCDGSQSESGERDSGTITRHCVNCQKAANRFSTLTSAILNQIFVDSG
jgi:hypothetical protein